MVFGLLFHDINLSKYVIIFKRSLDRCDIRGLITRNYAKQIVNNLPVHYTGYSIYWFVTRVRFY